MKAWELRIENVKDMTNVKGWMYEFCMRDDNVQMLLLMTNFSSIDYSFHAHSSRFL